MTNKKNNSISAVVLAAGKGVRMKSSLPKVLNELCGQPLVFYPLSVLSEIKEVKQKIVVTGYKRELLEEKVLKEFKDTEFSFQKRLNGSAKAVESALDKIKSSSVLVICGDSPILNKRVLTRLIKFHNKNCNDCTVLTKELEEPANLGRIIRDVDGSFLEIKEKTELSSLEKNVKEVNTGIYIFNKKALVKEIKHIKVNPKKKEYYLTDIISIFRDKTYKVKALAMRGKEVFLSVNTVRDLLSAEKVVKTYLIDRLIDKGIKIIDPKTTFVGPKTKIGKDSVIYPFTFLENSVRIGNHCLIGPFAHVRAGSCIGSYSQVGNYTEIVRSRLGKNVRMKHFSYVGDADIGDSVNIGAGTVIANYDGKNKNKTVVGKNAFIGSDSVLVAPVKIGSKATTGAGSVVKENVRANSVVVGVPAKEIKKKRRKTRK